VRRVPVHSSGTRHSRVSFTCTVLIFFAQPGAPRCLLLRLAAVQLVAFIFELAIAALLLSALRWILLLLLLLGRPILSSALLLLYM